MLPKGWLGVCFLMLLANPHHLCSRSWVDLSKSHWYENKTAHFLLGLRENHASVLIKSKFPTNRLSETSPVSLETVMPLDYLETDKGGHPLLWFCLPLSHTHTHPSAMRQGGPNRINSFGPAINWKLLNFEKLLSKCLHCTLYKFTPNTRTHAHTHPHTYIVCSSFDLLIEFVLIFIPEGRIPH